MPHTVCDSRFHELIDPDAPVTRLASGFGFTEGPVWHPAEQALFFSDILGDTRFRWTEDGGVGAVASPSNMANGMTLDTGLDLLVCEHATSVVAAVRSDGTRRVLCSHFEGCALNSPNDICVRSDGSVYFTDPTYGRMAEYGVARDTELGFQGVYRLAPGHAASIDPILVSDRETFSQPNGLCFSPCERWLYVNDSEQANIRRYEVAQDGRLKDASLFASGIRDDQMAGVPDGMKTDADGNVWVTAPGGLWVFAPDGALLGRIAAPGSVANFHWGGAGWRSMFLCAGESLYRLETKIGPHVEPFMRGLH